MACIFFFLETLFFPVIVLSFLRPLEVTRPSRAVCKPQLGGARILFGLPGQPRFALIKSSRLLGQDIYAEFEVKE